MAALSERSGIPVATVKYYLREGLLHPGERTSRTQSEYDESHVRRLGMIRALIDVGGLSVAHTAEVIRAMEDETVHVGQVLSVAQRSVSRFAATSTPLDRTRAQAELDRLVDSRGWLVSADNPGRAAAVDVLATFDGLGCDYTGLVQAAAEAADLVAETDLQTVVATTGGREQMVETVVAGTVLGDVLMIALRRMAQEHHARKQYP